MLPRKHEFSRMLLKRETENGKHGTGNREQGKRKGERGTWNKHETREKEEET